MESFEPKPITQWSMMVPEQIQEIAIWSEYEPRYDDFTYNLCKIIPLLVHSESR